MDAHSPEYAGAIAGMNETYGYTPAIGDCVIVEPPFLTGRRAGIVRHWNGVYATVEVDGEMLAYYPHEMTFHGKTG